MDSMVVHDIEEYLKSENIEYVLSGNKEMQFTSFCSLDNLKDDSITWVRFIDDVDAEKFHLHKNILLFAELGNEQNFDFNVIYVKNVHSTFFQVIEYFFSDVDPNNVEFQIESSAVVLSKNIGKNVYIGHHSYVGKEVVIGDNVKIFHNVIIQGRVKIGNDCVIDSHTIIGATGFGHYVDNNGEKRTAPHLGGVKIGNKVEIGCNTCIARGCLDDTVIEDKVMIDSMCFIAHNVAIKKGTMVIAGTCVGGSTTVGENSWLGINSTISDQIVVGENSFVGMATLVNKQMPANKVLVGIPARILRDNTEDSKIKHKDRGK